MKRTSLAEKAQVFERYFKFPNQYCPEKPWPKQEAFLMLKPPLWPLDARPAGPEDDPAEFSFGSMFRRPIEPDQNGNPREPGIYPYREVFLGGAAGPGKSSGLLMAALEYVDVPGYSALILRRTFKQLMQENAILDRSLRWMAGKSDAVWRASEYKFVFPSGATIKFGYCDTERDVYQYDSSEFQAILFDEVTSPTSAVSRSKIIFQV